MPNRGRLLERGDWWKRTTSRAQAQMVLVTGISGNTVTISPGLYMTNWRASQTPGAWWGISLSGDGVENVSLMARILRATSEYLC